MEEINRIEAKIKELEDAKTKIDSLDPVTKQTVLQALDDAIRAHRLTIASINSYMNQMRDTNEMVK